MSTNETEQNDCIPDGRRDPRERTFIGGIIIVNKNSTYNCLIKSRSKSGFGLKLGATAGIPDEFILVDHKTGERHKCRVAWRKKGGLGVQIIDE